MADLTPDEVMAKHAPTPALKKHYCISCSMTWPCDAYSQAQARKKDLARIEALEAVVMNVAKLNTRKVYCPFCSGEHGNHYQECTVVRAVELMKEGE